MNALSTKSNNILTIFNHLQQLVGWLKLKSVVCRMGSKSVILLRVSH